MPINRRTLAKKIRWSVAAIITILLAASVWGVYYVHSRPAEVGREVPTYSYQYKGEITYQVRLKPNSIFQQKVLGPGKIYYSKIVDKVNVIFYYQYTGDKPAAPLKGAYEVVASMEDPEVWRKEYVLMPFTELYGEGKTLSFQREFLVDLSFYNEFLKKLIEETGVSPKEPKLAVQVRLFVRAENPEGTVKESLTPTIIIPLNTGILKVEGDLSAKKEGALTKKVMVADPRIKKLKEKQIILLFIPILLGIILALFILLTENKPILVDKRKKLIDSIKKKYGERMVRVGEEFAPSGETTVIVLNSMEELVKVADELSKPIFYREPDSPEEFPTYYVFDGLTAFSHTPALAEATPGGVTLPGGISPFSRSTGKDKVNI